SGIGSDAHCVKGVEHHSHFTVCRSVYLSLGRDHSHAFSEHFLGKCGVADLFQRHSLPLRRGTQGNFVFLFLKKIEQCYSSSFSAIVTRRIWMARYMTSSPDSLQFAAFSIYSAIFVLQAYSFGYFSCIICASSSSSFGSSSFR